MTESAASEIAVKVHGRLNSTLGMRTHCTVGRTVWLYKSLVLSYLEMSTLALYHATTFPLSPLDWVQDRFLAELLISDVEALSRFALAPLLSRRDMAMGTCFTVVIEPAPVQFSEFVHPAPTLPVPRGYRSPHLHHNQQLQDTLTPNWVGGRGASP